MNEDDPGLEAKPVGAGLLANAGISYEDAS
jgi:hypothetical protein